MPHRIKIINFDVPRDMGRGRNHIVCKGRIAYAIIPRQLITVSEVYHFHNVQLRAVRKHVRQHKKLLSGAHIVMLEHVLPTTLEFVRHLNDADIVVTKFIGKPYSVDHGIIGELSKLCDVSILKDYDDVEGTAVLDDIVVSAINDSRAAEKRLVILDVGGYFCAPLIRLSSRDDLEFSRIAGVVEDTTFGHNRYVASADKIKCPIYSVARSELKMIEARFVGRDAVMAMDMTLRKRGISIAGRKALVLGYGMIGSNVARSLKAADLMVSVYDKFDHRNLQAFIDGFHIHKKRELIKEADIIFSATANCALSYPEIEECKSNVILCSVGSKDTEFDVKSIKNQSLGVNPVDENLNEYKLPNSRSVIVAKEGTAVNFILPSTPNEVLDLVFAEIVAAFVEILSKGKKATGSVNAINATKLSEIAKDWLVPMNQ